MDHGNPKLFETFGFTYADTPTFFALEPKTGNYYRQTSKFNGTNFDEISEVFKQGVENGTIKRRAS